MTKSQSLFAVRFCGRYEKEPRELVGGRDFRLDESNLVNFFRSVPSARFVDLLRIAMSVYAIDRLVRRKKKINGYRWPRSIQAQIGVLEPGFWNSDEVRQALTECVDFLSGDSWEFSFTGNSTPVAVDKQRSLTLSDEPPLLCLYSGGLDSAAGLVSRIAECPSRPVMPVTVWHQPRQKNLICEKQYPVLKERFGVSLTPLIVKAAMVWSSELRKTKEERSQRSRAFLFAAVGAAAAAMTGAVTIEVYESGIGAINLPLMAGMIGSKATRSCHPEFFRRMTHLCGLIAGREVNFHLPFRDSTKGQVVKRLADVGLHDLARATASCVHYPLRESAHKQCGVCPACLFRRLSMFAAGIDEPQGTYKYDLFGSAKRANRVPAKRLGYLKAMLMQVVQLGALESQAAIPPRIQRHLIGTEVIAQSEPLQPIVDLLLDYRREWLDLAAVGRRRGWSWTKLLDPAGSAQYEGASHASA